VLSWLQDELLRIAFDCHRNLGQLAELAERHRDRKPDLADLCLIGMRFDPDERELSTIPLPPVEENDFRA